MPDTLPTRSRLRHVFVGSDGVRAGWSVLIFIVVMALPAFAVGTIARHFHLKPPGKVTTIRPVVLLVSESLTVALVALGNGVMRRIERRSFWSYGLASASPGRHLAAGGAVGLASVSLLVGLMAAGGYLVFDGLALHGLPVLGYGAIWLLGFFLVALAEETLFRGYILYTLTRGLGFWWAALLTSLLFGLAHVSNGGENVVGLIGVVLAGLMFCLLFRISGSLWLVIGFHALWDWAQSYLYGTPDSGLLVYGHLLASHAAGNARFSGGSAGPEGSVLVWPVMMAGLLVMVLAFRRARRSAAPWAPSALPAE